MADSRVFPDLGAILLLIFVIIPVVWDDLLGLPL
jgi:hypothetical protein